MSENHPHRRRRPHSNYDDDDDGEQKQQSSASQTKRRKQAAISLASFSSKKGHDRALQEYKKRKETKFDKNSRMLREYQRAMKKEGYEVGKGASRKRDSDTRGGDDAADGENGKTGGDEGEESESEINDQQKSRSKKRYKSDPLAQAKLKAERRKAEQEELISDKKDRQEKEGQKQHNRKRRAKKMMKRTRRGQPLMKNVIGDMLDKIKSDVGDA